MKHLELKAAVLLLSMLVFVSPADAEDETSTEQEGSSEQVLSTPSPHQGQFVALGLNYGIAAADDADRGWRQISHGPNFTLRLGEAITSWVDLGLEMSLGVTTGSEALTLGRLTAMARWYPFERLFVHTALGFGIAGGKDTLYEGYGRMRYGDVYVLGLGYQFYLGDRKKSGGWMMSPTITAEVGPSKHFMTVAGWAGLEFSYWGGLTKNKLKLPVQAAYSRDEDD
jgi:hypothetical protein